MTHKLFAQQGGRGVSLDRFRTFLKRLQEGLLKLEFAHYDLKGTLQTRSGDPSIFAGCPSVYFNISFSWQTAGQALASVLPCETCSHCVAVPVLCVCMYLQAKASSKAVTLPTAWSRLPTSRWWITTWIRSVEHRTIIVRLPGAA